MKKADKDDLLKKGYKNCSRCGSVKYLNEFYANKHYPDGMSFYCKVCQKALVDLGRQRKKDNKLAKEEESC